MRSADYEPKTQMEKETQTPQLPQGAVSSNFFNFFKVTEEQLSELWEVFIEYGMTKGEAEHRSKANHYFLQGICQYHSVEWNTWNKKLTPFVRNLIKTKFPQFMVQNKKWRKY